MKRVLFSAVLLTIILSLGGCGSGGGKGKSLSYFMLMPSDTSVVETSQPTFVMERNTNNTSSALACDSSNTDSHLAKLQVARKLKQAKELKGTGYFYTSDNLFNPDFAYCSI